MARIKLAYIGGGSTRAPGTLASLIAQGANFAGSEVVLIDLDPDHLEVVRALGQRLARSHGANLTITATTDRRAGLTGCDAVLSSYRPGGFEARLLDERIPLNHHTIGQETQGPGGFFMAFRSIYVMKAILADIERACPDAIVFNYTNPINILSQAVADHSPVTIYSLCEGPILFPRQVARAAGLDPDQLDTVMIGLNHASWSVRHRYRGEDVMPLIREACARARNDPTFDPHDRRVLEVASAVGALPPAEYFQYYYYQDEVLAELQAKPTTRSEDILANVPSYWAHYREQAQLEAPALDPERSRGGIYELELALDLMDAIFNDRREVLPVNLPNRGAIADLPDDVVVEVPAYVGAHGATPLASGRLPAPVAGLVKALAEYQHLTAHAAWDGTRRDAVAALLANPLVRSLDTAHALYDEMAAAHAAHLPARLLG